MHTVVINNFSENDINLAILKNYDHFHFPFCLKAQSQKHKRVVPWSEHLNVSARNRTVNELTT